MEEKFIDRNNETTTNIFKLMKIGNFGLYLNTKETNLLTSLTNKNAIHKAMTKMFPNNAEFIDNIEYLIKPSNHTNFT